MRHPIQQGNEHLSRASYLNELQPHDQYLELEYVSPEGDYETILSIHSMKATGSAKTDGY